MPVNPSLRSPGASAVIYGGIDAQDVVFNGVAEALAHLRSTSACSASPKSFVKRRMGVAVAWDACEETARDLAKQAAAQVKPRTR